MSAREQDPAVWAAAFGAAWIDFYRRAFDGTSGHPSDRRREALETIRDSDAILTMIADAAVRALHPSTAPADRLAALEAAERAYLLEAGWIEGPADSWLDRNRPAGSISRNNAIGFQRHRDMRARDAKP